jgi:NAD+ synthase
MKMKKIILPKMNPELVAKEIGAFIIKTVLKVNATGAVIGLSGGVDSTTTAALAKKAFDRYNQTHNKKLELVGYILPSGTNNPADAEDGIKVAKRLGIRFEIQSIEPIVSAYKETNPEAHLTGYDKGNLMSRIRANILSTKSATEKKVLLGTGNKDEDFGIGYYTLFGDGAVHCSPIAGLSKRLVRQMARFLSFEDLADRVPTAGLEVGQTDFKDLGYNYDAVELVTEAFEQGFDSLELIENQQVKNTLEPQLNFGKFKDIKEIIQDISKRHHTANLKAEIIHPPVAQVTLNYEVEA